MCQIKDKLLSFLIYYYNELTILWIKQAFVLKNKNLAFTEVKHEILNLYINLP